MDAVGGWARGRFKIAAAHFLRVVSIIAGGGSRAAHDWRLAAVERSHAVRFFNSRPHTSVRIPLERCDSQGGYPIWFKINHKYRDYLHTNKQIQVALHNNRLYNKISKDICSIKIRSQLIDMRIVSPRNTNCKMHHLITFRQCALSQFIYSQSNLPARLTSCFPFVCTAKVFKQFEHNISTQGSRCHVNFRTVAVRTACSLQVFASVVLYITSSKVNVTDAD